MLYGLITFGVPESQFKRFSLFGIALFHPAKGKEKK